MSDVTVTGRTCTISDRQLIALGSRARSWFHDGVVDAYALLPIDRESLAANFENNFLTPRNICAALLPSEQATAKNHNALRDHYRGNAIEEDEARRLGVVVKTFDIARGPEWCPAGTSCEDVLDALDDDRLPAVMFATDRGDEDAKRELIDPANGMFIAHYRNQGPVHCKGSAVYHAIAAGPGAVEFVTTSVVKDHWTTFALRKSCAGVDGHTYAPTDLVVSSGLRVFIPIHVTLDGTEVSRTLIIDSAVSEPSSAVLRVIISVPMATERFTATAIVRKLFLDARAHGWPIE